MSVCLPICVEPIFGEGTTTLPREIDPRKNTPSPTPKKNIEDSYLYNVLSVRLSFMLQKT